MYLFGSKDLKELQLVADIIREDIIISLLKARSGHPAGALGMAEILAALYFKILNHHPQNPNWPGRDRLVLSNGHICPALYSALANAGYFPKKELLTLRKLGSRLQGHPHRPSLPGLETTSGPLGSGLSQSAGMALGLKMDNKSNLVFCLCSDGEQQEGNHWEAVMFAAKYQLNNLIAITDRNYIQIDGFTEEVMPLDPLVKKYRSFNWNVAVVEGNNLKKVLKVLKKARKNKNRPLMIIANTIPGKGVSFMENRPEWHGRPPNDEEAERAISEIQSHESKLGKDWYQRRLDYSPLEKKMISLKR
jgi:transketolase